MSDLPPPPMPAVPNDYQHDQDNLNLLSVFYFILAALQTLAGCIPIMYILFGVGIAAVGTSSGRSDDAAAGAGMGAFVACFGIFILLLLWGLAFLNYSVGKALRARRRLTLCYIMAGVACLNFPLGTVLGVITFVVLSRQSIKASFT